MTQRLILFICHVPKAGFRWLETHPIPPTDQSRHWYLTPGREPGMRGGGGQTYNPLEEHTALFRVFADTEPSRDGIKAFAGRFGLARRRHRRADPALRPTQRQGRRRSASGEALSAWTDEILIMRFADRHLGGGPQRR